MTTPDWLETKLDRMVRKLARSQWRENILADAREIAEEGFTWDVALVRSLRYWEGHPQTGRVLGVDP